MKLSPSWLLALSVLASCSTTVRIEDGSNGGSTATGVSDDGVSDDGFSDDGPSDGGYFGQGGFGLGPSSGGFGAGPIPGPDCYEESLAFALNPDSFIGVVPGQDVCSPTQIGDIFGFCVNLDDPMLCATITEMPEYQACADCILGGEEPPMPVPVVIRGEGQSYLTLYACAAHLIGLPECEVPVQSRIFCAFTACEQCKLDEEEFNECVNWALNESICTSVEIPDGCEVVFGIEQIPEECLGDATTLEEGFGVLADFYCGAP